MPKSILDRVAWTMLIASTRDEAGGGDAVALRAGAHGIDWQEAEEDAYFASALMAAYHEAEDFEEAAHWAMCALRHDAAREYISRRELLERAWLIAGVLDERGQADVAEALRTVQPVAAVQASPAVVEL